MTRPGDWLVTGTGDSIGWSYMPPEVGWSAASPHMHGERDARGMILVALADLGALKEQEAFFEEWLTDMRAAHPEVFERIAAEHPDALGAWSGPSRHEGGG